jgi:TPR repeat protein
LTGGVGALKLRGMRYLTLALAVLVPAAAQAKTLTVSKKGPFKTLGEALLKAEAGDELLLQDMGDVGVRVPRSNIISGSRDVGVLWSTPAAEKDMRNGDELNAIDGVSLSQLERRQVIAALYGGPAGSKVRLQWSSNRGQAKEHDETLVRKPLVFPLGDDCANMLLADDLGDDQAFVALGERGAAQGKTECQRELAVLRENSNPWLAGKTAKPCAEAGDAVCQRIWGYLVTSGEGAPKNKDAGLYWLRTAIEQGDVKAMIYLGQIYEEGRGVRPNGEQAKYWYAQASKAGSTDAGIMWDNMFDFKDIDAPEPKPKAPAGAVAAAAPAAAPAAAAKAPGSDVDSPTYKKPARERDLAVVIGIEKYPELPAAPFAERDADAVRAHLIALGYPERNVFTLKGSQATRSALAKELEARLKRLADERSSVFVYFSGHGAPDPKTGDAYLVPYDGDPAFLEETAYPLKRLYETLGRLPSKRVVVALDSCFSGAGGRSVLAKGLRPLVNVSSAPKTGRVISLTAAAGGEVSGSSDEAGHGLFTYYLLKGLNEGKTQLGPLAAYVKPRVQDEARRQNRDQTPQLAGDGAEGFELGR